MWECYDVKAPFRSDMYESTVRQIKEDTWLSLTDFPEPKIEPKIVFGLGAVPRSGMDEAELLASFEWVALGFEIVSSIYSAWQFKRADAVAACGLHFALRIGEGIPIESDVWMASLVSFRLDLFRNGECVARGGGADVLGSPLKALRHLNDLLSDLALGVAFRGKRHDQHWHFDARDGRIHGRRMARRACGHRVAAGHHDTDVRV